MTERLKCRESAEVRVVAKFGRGLTVVSKRGGGGQKDKQTHKGTLQLYRCYQFS